jgi:DNA invertase Pin-like site-specific DNA recombinase
MACPPVPSEARSWAQILGRYRKPSHARSIIEIAIYPGPAVATVLGGLAEFERALIIARTGDGRVLAKARGVRFGRPPALTSHQRQEDNPATRGRRHAG